MRQAFLKASPDPQGWADLWAGFVAVIREPIDDPDVLYDNLLLEIVPAHPPWSEFGGVVLSRRLGFPAAGACNDLEAALIVDATWTSSDANVIAIDSGSIRAVGRGSATLTARAEGKTASETFKVEPNMAGTWSGNFVVDQCNAGSGSMGELMCNADPSHPRGSLAVGTSVPITFQIQKSGEALTATAASGDWRGTLTGTDRGSNFMTFSGELTGNRTRVTIVFWNSQAKTDVMEGQIVFEVRIDNVPSNAAVVAHFDQVMRR